MSSLNNAVPFAPIAGSYLRLTFGGAGQIRDRFPIADDPTAAQLIGEWPYQLESAIMQFEVPDIEFALRLMLVDDDGNSIDPGSIDDWQFTFHEAKTPLLDALFLFTHQKKHQEVLDEARAARAEMDENIAKMNAEAVAHTEPDPTKGSTASNEADASPSEPGSDQKSSIPQTL